MLITRLSIRIVASKLGGMTATKIANDNGKSACLIGVIIFSFAAYIHLIKEWSDYPIGYHFTYLILIIPVTGLSYFLYKRK